MKVQSANGTTIMNPTFLRTEKAPRAEALGSFASALANTAEMPVVPIEPEDESSDTGLAEKSKHDAKSVIDEFTKWAHMTPPERIRAPYLEAHGMSEGDLSHLPPDVQQEIEDEIKKQIEQQTQDQTKSQLSGL